MATRRMGRRAMLRGAAGGVGMVILGDALSARAYAANEKLNLAHVGVGGRGTELLLTFSKMANPAALCDVNEARGGPMFRQFPDSPRFQDFRVMLDKMGKGIDAVVVAAPDHSHATASAAAIRAGKAVYTEKPLTRTVQESRALRALAREHRAATQMGNQGTASGQFREALEIIRSGGIGQVKEVHIWNSAGGADTKALPAYAKDTPKVPAYLNWDLWLGPAAQREFHPLWLRWHAWRDFGTGTTGNWASHSANLAFMSLKVHELWHAQPPAKPTIRVEAKASSINRISFPLWEEVKWHIPARGELPPIIFAWHNGKTAPGIRDLLEQLNEDDLDWGDKREKKWKDHGGAIIVGTAGKVRATEHNATYWLLPKDKYRDYKPPAPALPRSGGHEREWLQAIKGGKPAMSNYDYSGPLNEFLQLANVATQFEGALEYDPLAGRITNNQEADKLLTPEYRKGWSL